MDKKPDTQYATGDCKLNFTAGLTQFILQTPQWSRLKIN
jgi:hypothetical protein